MQDESGLRSRFGGVGWGATYWDYDVLGRPTRRHDPRGTVVTYGYGPAGHRTELTVEGQGSVYYEHGPTGNMDRLLDGKTGLFTYYEYDPAGRARLQHHPNLPAGGVEGATATYFLYDAAGRLGEKVTKRDSDASVLVRFAYTRDAAGNPIAIEREAALGAFYYQYDQLQRLAYEGQFIAGDREYENYYEYDAAGNRTLLRHGETGAEDLTYYTYDAANELTSLHGVSGWTYFAYDANGNTVMEQAPSYTRYYDWDGRDMLVGVRSTEQGWTDDVYRYDGLASRVSTLESGGLTYYDWDSINVIQEKDADGDVTDRQVHGYAPIFSVGDIALMDNGGTPYVPDFDQVGTLWSLLNSSAAAANSYEYDAFGVARSVSETVSNLYRFGTKRLDADAALYHFIARPYRACLGRFAASDRLVRLNGYSLAGNRPLKSVDPSGLAAQRADGDGCDPCGDEGLILNASLRHYTGESVPPKPILGRSLFAATVFAGPNGTYRCCSRAAVVQIVRTVQKMHVWPDRDTGWCIDEVFPYEWGDRVSVEWNDTPGVDDIQASKTIYELSQTFEDCIVCFDKGRRCGEVLGCFEWGHYWEKQTAGLFAVRWIWASSDDKFEGFRGVAQVSGALPRTVTPNYWQVAGDWIKAYCLGTLPVLKYTLPKCVGPDWPPLVVA